MDWVPDDVLISIFDHYLDDPLTMPIALTPVSRRWYNLLVSVQRFWYRVVISNRFKTFRAVMSSPSLESYLGRSEKIQSEQMILNGNEHNDATGTGTGSEGKESKNKAGVSCNPLDIVIHCHPVKPEQHESLCKPYRRKINTCLDPHCLAVRDLISQLQQLFRYLASFPDHDKGSPRHYPSYATSSITTTDSEEEPLHLDFRRSQPKSSTIANVSTGTNTSTSTNAVVSRSYQRIDRWRSLIINLRGLRLTDQYVSYVNSLLDSSYTAPNLSVIIIQDYPLHEPLFPLNFAPNLTFLVLRNTTLSSTRVSLFAPSFVPMHLSSSPPLSPLPSLSLSPSDIYAPLSTPGPASTSATNIGEIHDHQNTADKRKELKTLSFFDIIDTSINLSSSQYPVHKLIISSIKNAPYYGRTHFPYLKILQIQGSISTAFLTSLNAQFENIIENDFFDSISPALASDLQHGHEEDILIGQADDINRRLDTLELVNATDNTIKTLSDYYITRSPRTVIIYTRCTIYAREEPPPELRLDPEWAPFTKYTPNSVPSEPNKLDMDILLSYVKSCHPDCRMIGGDEDAVELLHAVQQKRASTS